MLHNEGLGLMALGLVSQMTGTALGLKPGPSGCVQS